MEGEARFSSHESPYISWGREVKTVLISCPEKQLNSFLLHRHESCHLILAPQLPQLNGQQTATCGLCILIHAGHGTHGLSSRDLLCFCLALLSVLALFGLLGSQECLPWGGDTAIEGEYVQQIKNRHQAGRASVLVMQLKEGPGCWEGNSLWLGLEQPDFSTPSVSGPEKTLLAAERLGQTAWRKPPKWGGPAGRKTDSFGEGRRLAGAKWGVCGIAKGLTPHTTSETQRQVLPVSQGFPFKPADWHQHAHLSAH